MPTSAFVFLVAASLLGPVADARTDVCANLLVPEVTGLVCRPGGEDGSRVEVAPEGGRFADLSRLTLRELDRQRDALAWEGPDRWLESQMEIDLGAWVGSLRRLAREPDSPFAGEEMKRTVEALALGLDRLGRLPLAACRKPRRVASGHRVLRCRFGAEPFALYMQVRLIEAGDRRWAANIRTLGERRLRHFEAVANSFHPTS
jgi:hypothetical protein